MSVLIAHTGAGVFVRNSVQALHEAGLLQTFATTLVADPDALWQRVLAAASSALGVSVSPLQRRPAPEVPRALLRSHPNREMLRTLCSRFDRSGVLTDRIWHWMTLDFDRWSASLIDAETKAVYGYEYNALALFQRAAAMGLPRILELPCAEHEYISEMQAHEWSRLNQPESAYMRHARQQRVARTARRRAEFALATCVIVNSEHTLSTYRHAGLHTDHFHVLPLGAEIPVDSELQALVPAPHPRLIWAGNFSVAKGAHLLLEALGSLDGDLALGVDAYGSVALPDALCQAQNARLRIHGPVPRADLFAAFRHADALILPSLSDGWGLVVTEALAHGLPVLTTPAVGASGLIRDGINGRVFEAGSAGALRDILIWCATHRAQLQAMRPAARAAIESWQWPDYRRALGRIVSEHVAGA